MKKSQESNKYTLFFSAPLEAPPPEFMAVHCQGNITNNDTIISPPPLLPLPHLPCDWLEYVAHGWWITRAGRGYKEILTKTYIASESQTVHLPDADAQGSSSI